MKTNLDLFYVQLEGAIAFERVYQWTSVVFEIAPGIFEHWDAFELEYGEGLPEGIDIDKLKKLSYPIDELAEQLGIYAAYGLDL